MIRLLAHSILFVSFVSGPGWLFLILLFVVCCTSTRAPELVLWGIAWDLAYAVPFYGPLGISIWGSIAALFAYALSQFVSEEVRIR